MKISEDTVRKLALAGTILCQIPSNEGENHFYYSYMGVGLNYCTLVASLDWKGRIRHIECRSLDQLVEEAKKLHLEILGFPYYDDGLDSEPL